jgi:RHS repeat-associated protein
MRATPDGVAGGNGTLKLGLHRHIEQCIRHERLPVAREPTPEAPLDTFSYNYPDLTPRVSTRTSLAKASPQVAFSYFSTAPNQELLQNITYTTLAGSPLAQFAYQYDPNENIAALTETYPDAPAQTQSFTFDSYNQLQAATAESNNINIYNNSYSPDPNGNMSVPGMGLSYDATNRITATASGAPVSYDSDGNLTAINGVQYTYDGFDRLASVVSGSLETDFVYDGLGRMTQVIDKQSGTVVANHAYIWSRGRRYLQLDLTNIVGGVPSVSAEYFSQGETNGAQAYYYVSDALGSTREVTALGQIDPQHPPDVFVGGRYEYDPLGNMTTVDGEALPGQSAYVPAAGFAGYFQYTGASPTPLSFAANRVYQPTLGRWLNRDPLDPMGLGPANLRSPGFNATDLNLYAYAGNDPITRVDPTGDWAYVVQTGSNVQIVIPIYFSGVGATAQNISTVVNEIQNAWTGNFGGYNVTTTVEIIGNPSDPSNGVSAVPPNIVDLMTSTGPVDSNTVGWMFGQWDVNSSSPTTFAHEASHLLGLADQSSDPNDITYGLQGGRSPTAQPSASDVAQAVQNNPWAVACH